MTRYIFITGGVVSSLGKGITSASLGAILEARGLDVTLLKLAPYINVDPGTMSPFQHGEVYVTEDGTETDLDLGHYERFIDAIRVLSDVETQKDVDVQDDDKDVGGGASPQKNGRKIVVIGACIGYDETFLG